MKKYIFIILLFLLAYEAYPQVRLSTMDSVTTFNADDIFWLNRKVTSTYYNKKVTWYRLRLNMMDYIDGLANTWASRQTFSKGATFSAASYGSVVFNDSLITEGGLWTKWLHAGSTNSYIGWQTAPFNYIWVNHLILPNAEGNDSVTISYDDSTITFSKAISMPSLTITETVNIDSGAVFNTFVLGIESYSPSTVADTIITLSSGAAPVIHLILPGNLSTGISRIVATPATNGQIMVIRNATVPYTILLKDYVSVDDNLYLAGNFTMGYNDILTLMCIGEEPALAWVEISRSNN